MSAIAAPPSKPQWQLVAEDLESLAARPNAEQSSLALATKIILPGNCPAPVAAVILRKGLSGALRQSLGGKTEIPEALTELESELGVATPAYLTTESREEVSGWFEARYMLLTARGLRRLKPEKGDVVSGNFGDSHLRVISSVGETGRIYFKGRGSAWPNHLDSVTRVGTSGHSEAAAKVEATLINAKSYGTTNTVKLAALERYLLENRVPSPEAIRALEELLESGDSHESPFQSLLTTYPELLASTVAGGWQTYVIPQKRLGAEYVPDFLVLGINSVGPQWVAVEIEAARHEIVNKKDRRLSTPTRHAVGQINDWREWLTDNIAYAQNQLGLYGLTNNSPGLVIIGRDSPTEERQASRAQSEENAGIAIHSWDWLLRHAQSLAAGSPNVSEFAFENMKSRN